MNRILWIIWIAFINITSAYNIFEGLLAQKGPCFETIHGENCNTSLSKVFAPSYNGSNINPADTKLWLFTVANPDKAEPLHKCGGRLPDDSEFDPNINTIVICHGWLDGVCRTAWMREIKEQLFLRGEYNVILADWTWGNTFDPVEAAINSQVVGLDIAFVVVNIMKQTNLKDGDRFHLVGHSYGAFAVNAAGRELAKKPETKVRRLTLLDPAVAPVKEEKPMKTFSSDHAKFVDAIHGDTSTCVPVGFGSYEPVGHADFYPNGGNFQVSCYPYIISSFLKGDFAYALASAVYPGICSHVQVIQYFKVSINHPQGLFIGAECQNYTAFLSGDCNRCCKKDFSKCAIMGMDAELGFPYLHQPAAKRTYYLNLGLECPYNEDYLFSVFRNC